MISVLRIRSRDFSPPRTVKRPLHSSKEALLLTARTWAPIPPLPLPIPLSIPRPLPPHSLTQTHKHRRHSRNRRRTPRIQPTAQPPPLIRQLLRRRPSLTIILPLRALRRLSRARILHMRVLHHLPRRREHRVESRDAVETRHRHRR